jgi:excisionase family DNA binding protein
LNSVRLSTILNYLEGQRLEYSMSIEPWVTAEQVAQHLGVVKETVYRWRERKALPANRVGRLWKFKLSEVDDWVRAGGAGGAEEKQNDS